MTLTNLNIKELWVRSCATIVAIFIEANECTFCMSYNVFYDIYRGRREMLSYINPKSTQKGRSNGYYAADFALDENRKSNSTLDMPVRHRLRERCPPRRCTEGVGEVLRFVRYRLASKFHDGD